MDVPPILTQPAPPQPAPAGKPKPHGCLTAWLVVMLLYYALMTVGNLAEGLGGSLLASKTGKSVPTELAWVTLTVTGLNAACLFFSLFVFARKRWAFAGVVLASVATMAVYLVAGKLFMDAALCLLWPIILYGVLQIGGENSGWKQLK